VKSEKLAPMWSEFFCFVIASRSSLAPPVGEAISFAMVEVISG